MDIVFYFLVFAIALLHIYFLVLEMFLWTKPIGLKIFKNSREHAQKTATLAANQGLYNGFLAAGLIWSLVYSKLHSKTFEGLGVTTTSQVHGTNLVEYQIALFFLNCVFIAGVYGGYTVNRRIFFIQGVPAALAIAIGIGMTV